MGTLVTPVLGNVHTNFGFLRAIFYVGLGLLPSSYYYSQPSADSIIKISIRFITAYYATVTYALDRAET